MLRELVLAIGIPLVLLLLAVMMGLTTGMTMSSQTEIAMAANELNYAGARAAAEAEGREKMVRTTQAAVSGTAKLEAGLGLLTETEDIGVSVIDNMTQQRESVPSAGRASVRSACSSGGCGGGSRGAAGRCGGASARGGGAFRAWF